MNPSVQLYSTRVPSEVFNVLGMISSHTGGTWQVMAENQLIQKKSIGEKHKHIIVEDNKIMKQRLLQVG